MISGPAPLEGLEIWIGGQGYELLHKAMTVAERALSSGRPDTAFGVLEKRLISNAKSLFRDLINIDFNDVSLRILPYQ
jgi:hypothetical protein